MSTDKFFVIAFLAVATTVYVTARPLKEVVLSEVANKTMCPIKVEINDDPNRIPRRIKFLKCAEEPNELCSAKLISHGCCTRRHHDYFTECVEVYDYVQVQYLDNDQLDVVKVPVGCSCLIEGTTKATEPK